MSIGPCQYPTDSGNRLQAKEIDILEELVLWRVLLCDSGVSLCLFSLVDDAGAHVLCVQFDSAVEWVLSLMPIQRISLSWVST